MAKTIRIHDGTTKPIVETDTAYPGGHRLVVHDDQASGGGGGATEATLATRLSESDFDTKVGSLTEAAPASDTASSGLNGRLQRIAQRLTSLIALLPASLGGKAAANSLAVTLATDEPLVGALTETAPASDTASSGLNGRLQRIAQRLTSLIALFPTALGGTTSANSLPVVLSSDGPFATQTGSITETAPASDTASSGLNGRLQRIAQRLTSLIALLPTSLGTKTAANSLSVTTSSDDALVALNGAVNETAPASDTASSGLNGRLQRIAQRLTSLIALLPAALVSGRLDVNIGAAPATVTTQGDVAHDGVDSGNPVKIGRRAVAFGTNPTPVAAGDRTDALSSRAGLGLDINGHPNTITYAEKFTTAQTNQALITVAAGTKIVVTGFLITCNNANTVNVAATLGFGTATVPASGNAGIIGAHGGIGPGSGFGQGAGGSIVGVGADDEDVRLTSTVPTGGDIWVTIKYFTTPA